jgi:hypothetical protein
MILQRTRARLLAATLTTLGIIALAATPAVAQDAMVREGTLSSTDPVFDESDGRVGDAYTFEATPGQFVTVTLRSGEFDTFLRVESPAGVMRENDDDGGGTDSSLSFVIDEPGTWTVRAAAFSAESEGAYTLTWSATQPGETSSISGRLSKTSPKGQPYDSTAVELGEGTVMLIVSNASAAPLALIAVGPDGERRVGTTDGSGSNLTMYGAPAGTWTVWIGGEEGQGVDNAAYSLTTVVSEGGSAENYEGRLDEGDLQLPLGEFADVIEIDVAEGQDILFELSSLDFDTFLVVESAGGAPMVRRNDDAETPIGEMGFGGSSLSFEASETSGRGGTWRIWVTSFSAGATGDYLLRVIR